MYTLRLFVKFSILVIKRALMTRQERLISEMIATHDGTLASMVKKADRAKRLLLQSIFDRQIQEYIHRTCRIPIDSHDRYIYGLNSIIIHHPSSFDRVRRFSKKNRFISPRDYDRFISFFFSFLKDL